MDLVRALRLFPPPSSLPGVAIKGTSRAIAFVGAGGKTTAIFQLAHDLVGLTKYSTIVTASTHLGSWQVQLADHHRIVNRIEDLEDLPDSGVILLTGDIDGDRTLPLPPERISLLNDICHARGIFLLIEADGSRGLPLKAPAAHEPPIPPFADLIVFVVGVTGLDKPLGPEVVHHPELFSVLGGLSLGERITSDAMIRVLLHHEGGLKNIPPNAQRVVLLNQAEDPAIQSICGRMAPSLLNGYDTVLVGSLHKKDFQVIEKTAAVILAAGSSTRYGKPKQLLNWHGLPFVRIISQTALEAGLSPVVVVTGSNSDEVESALKDLPVHTIRNAGWSEGQAGSIRSGINYLVSGGSSGHPGMVGSAIFLLADQPQVTVSILEALKSAHAAGLQQIVAPLISDRRANPVLFDRITFNDLLQLRGDVGGRGIFNRHPVAYLPWHDERLLLDIDTPEQYAQLMEFDQP